VVAQNIAFGIIAVIMVVGALRVVTVNNVVHAALWLVLVLAGAAAQYILLTAEFVAVTQVLVYIGAVMVLFLFGTMLTRAQLGKEKLLNNPTWYLGIPA
jgi:NADH-quinone oxidoreductase subunit J